MKQLLLYIILLVWVKPINAQTRYISVGKTYPTTHQNWTLSSIYIKPFYTILKWNVECKDITSSVTFSENTYLEDCDTHIRYGLSQKPKIINPHSFNQIISYETIFKSLPTTVRKIRLVSSNLVINEIDLKKLSNKESVVIQDIAVNVPESDVEESPSTPSLISDVDINIKEESPINNKTFVVIIANEKYTEEVDVPYAERDGNVFKEYCVKTLGIPDNNIRLVCNGTLNNIKRQISWLTQIMDAYNGEESIIFYYAGHGIPDEVNKSSFLLPIDGYGQDVSTGYSLESLYKTLGSKPSKSVFILLDACFSGSKRDGEMLASARGIAIKTKPQTPQGNMIVLSASQGDETAYSYKEKGHGMFTYYLLKKLQETKGNATLGEISDYVTDQVKKTSIVINGKIQTPNVSVSGALGDSWKNIKLK